MSDVSVGDMVIVTVRGRFVELRGRKRQMIHLSGSAGSRLLIHRLMVARGFQAVWKPGMEYDLRVCGEVQTIGKRGGLLLNRVHSSSFGRQSSSLSTRDIISVEPYAGTLVRPMEDDDEDE